MVEQPGQDGMDRMIRVCEALVTSIAANNAGNKKDKKKKRHAELASVRAAAGQKKRKRSRSSSSSSSDEEEEDSEREEDEPEPAEDAEQDEAGQVARRMEALERRLKKDREAAKQKEKLLEGEAKQKVKFAEQLLQVKTEANKERIIFLQKIYMDCAAVEIDLAGKKVKLRKDVEKRFASMFTKIMQRIALLLVDDRTPGMFAQKHIIEHGETEAVYSKAEVDRMKKLESQLKVTGGARRGRGAQQQQAGPAQRPPRKAKQARGGGGHGKPQCTFPGCIASGNTAHARSACWKDPASRKYRPQNGQQRQTGEQAPP